MIYSPIPQPLLQALFLALSPPPPGVEMIVPVLDSRR